MDLPIQHASQQQLQPSPSAVDAETLIVSDVHLGIRASRPESLLNTLRSARYERLILLGDILHDHNVRQLCVYSWELLAFISNIAREKRGEVIWIHGNHDRHLAPLIAKLTGIQARESFAWTTGQQRFIATHGDRFDDFVSRNQRLADWITAIYTLCQNRLSINGNWPTLLDKVQVSLSGINQHLAKSAAQFADAEGADVIVCGHTHVPWASTHPRLDISKKHLSGEVRYYNSGSWVRRPASFLSISNGAVAQHSIP